MTATLISTDDDSGVSVWSGLSTDTKPNAVVGSFFFETDTKRLYKQYASGASGWGLYESGGAAHVIQAASVVTLESFVISGGASQSGTSQSRALGMRKVRAIGYADSGSFGMTVTVYVSHDDVHFLQLGVITLSGTGSASTAETDTLLMDDSWLYIRTDISGFSGTNAACDVLLARE